MPDLKHRLQNLDLGFLKIVADLWGVDLEASDARSALPKLLSALLDPSLMTEIVEALPDTSRKAMDELVIHEGWIPWGRFTQRFGELREVGPGRRDREKPYLDPVSACETLWYRGLIGRDFLRRAGELQECAYIPDEFLEWMPPVESPGPQLPGRPASPKEITHIQLVTDRILDHTCTLLAALRLEQPKRSPAVKDWSPPFDVVFALLSGLKLITSSEQPVPEDARPFLEMPRGEALTWLVQGWIASDLFNELHLIPGLICDGAWHNDPKATRAQLIALLSEVPEDQWWHLDSFVNHIHEKHPDFQRPAGDFDTWLIRDARTGNSLRGKEHWDAVDGALIRYIITGPMHWFGLIDLAAPQPDGAAIAFRFSQWSEKLLLGQPVTGAAENGTLEAFSDARIKCTPQTPRLARYQISRFGLWIEETPAAYIYQLTPASLSMAAEQGLKITHLETLLEKYGQTPPPSLVNALHQWDKQGGQVRIYPGVILRVNAPEILKRLRLSPEGRFLGDPLGPTAAMIHPGAVEKVAAALAKLGYLSDVDFYESEILSAEDTNDPHNHA